jgi:NitT/TauT family transport system substrate-binding protein
VIAWDAAFSEKRDANMQNRRHFLKTGFSAAAAGLAGAAAFVRARGSVAEEAPPETTSVRLLYFPETCQAPIDILDDLLRDEGFADVRYVKGAVSDIGADRVASGDADFVQDDAGANILSIDAGVRALMLAGVHPACFELFAHESVRSVVDLKGRTVGVTDATGGSSDYVTLKIIAASVGLNPAKDINWFSIGGAGKSDLLANGKIAGKSDLLANGKIDAFMSAPPRAQELRAQGTGHVILNSAVDRPWSQYFCCMLIGNVDFVRRNPLATKRVVRAMLRATDICAAKPDWVAQRLVERGFTTRYNYARQGLDDVSYRAWRDYDAEDAVRFWALRLRELGMIKSSPDRIIAAGTDWRFLKEVRKELGI